MSNKAIRIVAQLTLATVLAMTVVCADAQVAVSITVAPPPLPVYEQPPIPAPGYLWVPGYWSYAPDGYFWVPGTWVEPPEIGLLWTPGYWAWSGGFLVWNAGYWAPQIGFYGGVNYGYGYPGRGYEGGYWRDDHFYYNRTVNNISNVQVQNVYTRTVVNNVTTSNTSYLGGPGGIVARPTAEEQEVTRARHVPPTAEQSRHRTSAAARPELRAAVNHGRPPVAATVKPGDLSTRVVSARGAENIHLPGADQAGTTHQAAQTQARQSPQPEALARHQEQDHARPAPPPHGTDSQAPRAMEHEHPQRTQEQHPQPAQQQHEQQAQQHPQQQEQHQRHAEEQHRQEPQAESKKPAHPSADRKPENQ